MNHFWLKHSHHMIFARNSWQMPIESHKFIVVESRVVSLSFCLSLLGPFIKSTPSKTNRDPVLSPQLSGRVLIPLYSLYKNIDHVFQLAPYFKEVTSMQISELIYIISSIKKILNKMDFIIITNIKSYYTTFLLKIITISSKYQTYLPHCQNGI